MVRFQFSLAKELKMTRAELLERVSTSEFIEWIAFFTVENQDQERAIQRSQDQAQAKQAARRMAGF